MPAAACSSLIIWWLAKCWPAPAPSPGRVCRCARRLGRSPRPAEGRAFGGMLASGGLGIDILTLAARAVRNGVELARLHHLKHIFIGENSARIADRFVDRQGAQPLVVDVLPIVEETVIVVLVGQSGDCLGLFVRTSRPKGTAQESEERAVELEPRPVFAKLAIEQILYGQRFERLLELPFLPTGGHREVAELRQAERKAGQQSGFLYPVASANQWRQLVRVGKQKTLLEPFDELFVDLLSGHCFPPLGSFGRRWRAFEGSRSDASSIFGPVSAKLC